MRINFTALINEEVEGGYSISCLELGVTSQGETIDEAKMNIVEAVELYLESARDIGIVEEILEVASYTYAKVDDDGNMVWVAAPKQKVEIGKTYYIKGAMEMKNFRSEELDRTFDSVLFVQELSIEPYLIAESTPAAMPPGSKKSIGDKSDVSVEPADGGITIAELFQNKSDHADKMVKIRGKVVKFNAGIMGRNWVHIQDGTDFEGQYDLTFTTEDVFEVGTIVEVEGAVALDKDFGYGYKYDVLLENSKKLSVDSI